MTRLLNAARPWLRWIFGVAAPLGCAAMSIEELGAMPFEPGIPRIAALGFTAVFVSAMVVSNLRLSRAGGSAFRAGVLAMAALYALAHAVMLAPLLAIALLIWPLQPFAISPPIALYVYVDAVNEEWSRMQAGDWRRQVVAFAAGASAPFLIGALLASGARNFEQRIVDRYVDGPTAEAPGALHGLRHVSGLHDWSLLMDIARNGFARDPQDSRSRRAWTTLVALVGEDRASWAIFPD
jgi:hypothetical protein